MRLTMMAAALLAVAVPAAAPAEVAQARRVFTPEQVQADLTRYGVWLGRVNQAQAPVQAAAGALRERWDAAMASGDPARGAAAFRPAVSEFASIVERSNAALAALANEQFPALDLSAEERPDRIVGALQQSNAALGTAMQAYNPMLDAMIRNDEAGALRAARQLVNSVGHVMQSQVVIARASLASTARTEVVWEVRNFILLYFRVGVRIIGATPDDLVAGTDASLAPDLLRFAEEVERNAADGERKVEASIANLTTTLRAAERARDRTSAETARRLLRVLEIDREIFPVTREFAAVLRNEAARLRNGRVTTDALGELLNRLTNVRARFDEILARENAVLAGADRP